MPTTGEHRRNIDGDSSARECSREHPRPQKKKEATSPTYAMDGREERTNYQPNEYYSSVQLGEACTTDGLVGSLIIRKQ